MSKQITILYCLIPPARICSVLLSTMGGGGGVRWATSGLVGVLMWRRTVAVKEHTKLKSLVLVYTLCKLEDELERE